MAVSDRALLWTWEALFAATSAAVDGTPSRAVTGFSIDSRTLQPGEVFVALKDVRDGHEFVTKAFAAGASAALVRADYERQSGDGLMLRVYDPLEALERIAIAARARIGADARIIAVTGSAGKTTTKEMLRLCLETAAPGRVHASVKSYNNHWGVPLTLARMPAHTKFGVFEIGMNHAGEITPLSKMVRPHATLITTIAPVHIGNFRSIDDIAEAKAEIFDGLEPGGAAIINGNVEQAGLLRARAAAARARIIQFAHARDGHDGQVTGTTVSQSSEESLVRVSARKTTLDVPLGVTGAAMVSNAIAVVAALEELGVEDLPTAIGPLADFKPGDGRGARIELRTGDGTFLLIDESYNANPASVREALDVQSMIARERGGRSVAVLGDMLELGAASEALHRRLAETVAQGGTAVVLACGPMMRALYEALPDTIEKHWAASSQDLQETLLQTVRAGDVVMIKGSLGSKMGPLTTALKDRYPTAGALN